MVFAGRLLDSGQYVLWSTCLSQLLHVLGVYSVLGMSVLLAAMQLQTKGNAMGKWRAASKMRSVCHATVCQA